MLPKRPLTRMTQNNSSTNCQIPTAHPKPPRSAAALGEDKESSNYDGGDGISIGSQFAEISTGRVNERILPKSNVVANFEKKKNSGRHLLR